MVILGWIKVLWNPSLRPPACWANNTTSHHYTLSLSGGIRPRTQVLSVWKLTVRCSRNRGRRPRPDSSEKVLSVVTKAFMTNILPRKHPLGPPTFPAQNLRNYCLSRRLSTGAQSCKITKTVGTRCAHHEDWEVSESRLYLGLLWKTQHPVLSRAN